MNAKSSLTKAALVKELAQAANVSQRAARAVLEALVKAAYREAPKEGGFTLPGLCKMDTVVRKARKMRNPRTGETLLVAEHAMLRLRPLRKARQAITPPPENLVTVQQEMPAQEVLEDFSKAVSFRCPGCGQEIEAPAAAIGMIAPCPQCGKEVKIPAESEPSTMHAPAAETADGGMPAPEPAPVPAPEPVAEAEPEPAPVEEPVAPAPIIPPVQRPAPAVVPTAIPDEEFKKSQTIRIDLSALAFDANGVPLDTASPSKRLISFFCKNCRQEIEAPADLAGQPAECPACGMTFEVPFFSDPGTLHGSDLDSHSPNTKEVEEMKSRTIRIEVPDDL